MWQQATKARGMLGYTSLVGVPSQWGLRLVHSLCVEFKEAGDKALVPGWHSHEDLGCWGASLPLGQTGASASGGNRRSRPEQAGPFPRPAGFRVCSGSSLGPLNTSAHLG